MAAIDEFSTWELIELDQAPTQPSWRLPCLYKLDQRGKTRMWEIGFDDRLHSIVTRHGILGGKITTTPPKEVKLNKSGRDMLQQSLLQIRREFQDKMKEDYDYNDEPEAGKFNFMLAMDLSKVKEIKYPINVQLKIDGIRFGVSIKDGHVEMITRHKKKYDNMLAFQGEITKFLEFLPGVILDGEMCDREGRERTMSIVRTEKRVHEDESRVKYFIFDLYEGGKLPYKERYNLLTRTLHQFVEKYGTPTTFEVLPVYIAHSWSDVEAQFRQFAEEGEEGLVMKDPEAVYKPGRNKNTIKYKVEMEEEATIIEVNNAEGNEKGCATFTCLDTTGVRFSLRPGGTFEQRAIWLQHPELVLGQKYTFRYNCRSAYGVPIHPRGIGLRFDA